MGFVLDGVIDIVFVMSAHNDSDLFTRNLPSEAHKSHSEKLVWTIDEMTKWEKGTMYYEDVIWHVKWWVVDKGEGVRKVPDQKKVIKYRVKATVKVMVNGYSMGHAEFSLGE